MPQVEGDTILVVCDSDYLVDRLGEELSARRFEIRSVRSAADCLDVLEDCECRGVLSSYRLPDLSGTRLLRSVRVTHPNLPFVLVPKEGSETIASEAIEAGVSQYITEGEDAEAVVKRIVDGFQESTPLANDEQGQRYTHLIEVSPVPINLFDQTGETIWCNEAVLDLLGLDSRDELVGSSIFEFIHPDDHELATREIERVTEDSESVGPTQMKVRRADGAIRHIYVSTAIGRFLGENIGQAIVVDVTPLREAREDLKEEQRFIDTALNSLEDIFYVSNGRGELLRWNETVTDVTGVEEEQLAGKHVSEFFAAADRDQIVDSIDTVVETGSDTVEARVVDGDRQHVPYEFRGQRLSSSREEAEVRIVWIGRDMSAQLERERQLQILERWLRHNIRNALNVVQGKAEMIQHGDSDSRELAGEILDRTNYLIAQADKERKIVDMITKPTSLTPLSVGDIVERQVNLCRERHPTATIEFAERAEFEARTLSQLNLAIAELLDNAIKHTDSDPPRVRVGVTASQGKGTVRIADTGPGIPQMEVDEIFLDQDVNQIYHGTGFGIALAYWVARSSDGHISISENTPRGTVVEITLPTA